MTCGFLVVPSAVFFSI